MRAESLQLCPTPCDPTDHIQAPCLVTQSCLTLCDPMDCSPPGCSVHGILQERILEWVACPRPRDLSDPEIKPESLMSPALEGRFFTSAAWETHHNKFSEHLSSHIDIKLKKLKKILFLVMRAQG